MFCDPAVSSTATDVMIRIKKPRASPDSARVLRYAGVASLRAALPQKRLQTSTVRLQVLLRDSTTTVLLITEKT